MSRGLGRVQQGCLRVINEYEAAGRSPTTYNIAAEVYQAERDRSGNRWVTDAQHVAVKRALVALRRQGRIVGERDLIHSPDGSGRIERCHYWRTTKRQSTTPELTLAA